MITQPRVNSSQRPADPSSALALEPIELSEGRRELLREAQHWLGVWERRRDDEARGRLLQSLELLALL